MHALAEVSAPRYKPSSRSAEAVDITSNAYGYSRNAPSALEIGETAPDFVLPGPGGQVALRELRQDGEVVIVFYRGHW